MSGDVSKIEFKAEQDVNGNGIIDDDELTPEQLELKKKTKCGQKDLLKVFYFIYVFTFVFLLTKFIAYFLFDIDINLDMSKLAMALNVFIVFVGLAEGIRSFSKTATSKKRTPIPAFKLKILFGYLIAFGILTLSAVLLEIVATIFTKEGKVIPEFNANDFVDGLVSNVIAYLVARFGDKVAEHIDLSSFKLFKI